MNNELTEREFWVKYWESKQDIAVPIPSNFVFHKIIAQIIASKNIKSSIELGGFPGYYTVFLKKYHHLDTTLLDYFVHPPLVDELLAVNQLKREDIHVIETDLFQFNTEKKYDLVLSCGLIEHFKDTEDIIKRHIDLVSDNGKLLITLPNFKSLNGWVQKTFDIENYNKHYIECMNIHLLKRITESLGMKNVKAYYYGGFSLWLENKDQKSSWVKALVKSMWFVGKVMSKIIRTESKYTSPYLVLEAEK